MKNNTEIIETLLKNRGITTKKQKEEFFNPPHPDKINAKDVGINLLQLNKAVKRIKNAIKNKEKIIVYGDYDVDGVCAAAILWETLVSLGANTLPYIPSRFTEGYGLNIESIKKLKEEDPSVGLIITVDNGIVANEKVDFAKSLGVDVIITDHHMPGAASPKAHSIVHTTQISGSAVAHFLSCQLITNYKLKIKNLPGDHLGLAAMGTVADVLPLVGNNRSIVKHGLDVLRKSTRPGLAALCKEAGIDQKQIDTFHIGFVVGPRLNSSGRLEHAMDSLRLLCVKNHSRAQELARKLGLTNRQRQEKTEKTLKHIEENFSEIWSKKTPGILFAHHDSYEEGIVGIVAGRLVEKFYRPAIVMSRSGVLYKASARSITQVNIVEAIKTVGEGILENAGGHPMAAGFSILPEKLEVFKKKLTDYAEKLKDDLFVREARIDCEIEFSLVDQKLSKEIKKFAPFGFGNPTPVFKSTNVAVEDVRLIGKDKNHIKVLLYKDGRTHESVGFGMGDLYSKIIPGKFVDIVYSIEENNWRGNTNLQLKLKSIEGKI
ncbi:MAG: single-stranded-DNA-specific exonuclease RecJ [Patescibacteria group bacterium]